MNIVERLRKRNVPYGWLGLADAAADRIEALEAALRKIEQKLTMLNAGWASEGGPFDGEWVSEVMALAPEQAK
jgi:hypothetical protein